MSPYISTTRQLYALGTIDDSGGVQAPSAWLGGIELTSSSSSSPTYSWVTLGLGGTGLGQSNPFWSGNADGAPIHKVYMYVYICVCVCVVLA
jgi:hypothetical protein